MAQISVENVGAVRRPEYEAAFGRLGARGKTRKEATDRLMDLLHAVASEAEAPPLVIQPFPGGAFALVWFAPREGWTYNIKHPDHADPYTREQPPFLYEGRVMYLDSVRRTRDEAEREARKHLAQTLFNVASEYHTAPRVITHPDDLEDALSWEAWQRCVREAQEQGIEDTEAQRRYADSRRREAALPGHCRECGAEADWHYAGWPCWREQMEATDARMARFAAGTQTPADEEANEAALGGILDALARDLSQAEYDGVPG